MKSFFCLLCIAALIGSSEAQIPICISTDKTTSLVFPYPISHVDRGTQSVLAQPVKDVPTILLVKAGVKDFSETNLSVVTEDGSLYSFAVCYENNPARMVYHLPVNQKATTASYANSILDNPSLMNKIRDYKWNMISRVKGIYIKQNVIYYQLSLENKSPINYDIDLIRFYIRDKKKGKRTAIQEHELKPLYIAGNSSQVNANGSNSLVFALEKFTIPDGKYLAIQIMEKNGGRHLFMKVGNRKIMQATPLSDFK